MDLHHMKLLLHAIFQTMVELMGAQVSKLLIATILEQDIKSLPCLQVAFLPILEQDIKSLPCLIHLCIFSRWLFYRTRY
ncbi:hypothetical protein HanPI659440_Chr03g0105091 [Helianthus annuus]|nr:hypothetical protein HanPI659440_Chr03g0105091 [Helianthus annuus]